MADFTIQLTDSNFDETIKSAEVPVLVDFWASWCGPCKMVAPILEEIAEEYAGSLMVGKLNVEENRSTAMRFEIQTIPTMILMQGGEPTAMRMSGAFGKDQILEEVRKHTSI